MSAGCYHRKRNRKVLEERISYNFIFAVYEMSDRVQGREILMVNEPVSSTN